MINSYFNIDKLEAQYIYEEIFLEIEKKIVEYDILNIKYELFNFNSKKTLIRRNLPNDDFWNLKKLHDVISLVKLYLRVGVKYIIPLVSETGFVKSIGDEILNKLEKPLLGLHLRRGDRLNKNLRNSMNEETIKNKFDSFNYKSVFYCSNDQNYKIKDSRNYSNKNFKDILGSIEDNYLLFCIEMYIVDNCDISVRTFNVSSPFYFIENKTNKNYSISDYSMQGSDFRFKKIPVTLVKCDYEDYSKDNKESFAKPLIGISFLMSTIKRAQKIYKNRIVSVFFLFCIFTDCFSIS